MKAPVWFAIQMGLSGFLVGAAGFEPTTPSPPDWCANQAAPRSGTKKSGAQGPARGADYSRAHPAGQRRSRGANVRFVPASVPGWRLRHRGAESLPAPFEDGPSKLTTFATQNTDVYGAMARFAELKLRVSEKLNSKNNRLRDVVVIENIYWSSQ